jgi:hypothetical protein
MKRLALGLLLAVCAWGQQNEPKLLELKNIDYQNVAMFLGLYNVNVRQTPNPRMIAVQGTKESIAAAEEALKKVDVPPRDVEISFQVITASSQLGPSKVPADLEPVLKQLKNTLIYQSYQLLDALDLRVREGTNASTSSALPIGNGFLEASIHKTAISTDDKGVMVIRLDSLRFGARVRVLKKGGGNQAEYDYVSTGLLNASIDVPEGQKVVVGRANLEGMREGAHLLVVTAKVVR